MHKKWLLMLGLIIKTAIAINTIAFDCEHPDHEISIIAANHVEPCSSKQNKTHVKEVEIQLIQEKLFESITIKHCLIKRISILMYCGAFSHTSIVRNGLTRDIVDLSNEGCREIHNSNSYIYAGISIKDIEQNSTRNIDLVELGTVDDQGGCKGVSIATKKGTYDNVVMHTTLEIAISEYTSMYDTSKSKIILSNGNVCDATTTKCFDRELGTTIWNMETKDVCNKKARDVLYEGKALVTSLRERNNSRIEIGDLISVNNREHLFALQIKSEIHVCYQIAFETELDRIIVIQKNENFGFFFEQSGTILSRNTDISVYFNSKIATLAREFRNDMQKMYHEITHITCEISRDILLEKLNNVRKTDVSYGHIMSGQEGYKNWVSGHVIIAVKCVPVPVEIRESNKCYSNLPIIYENQQKFMEPIANTLLSNGKEIPCSRIASPTYSINGKWLNINQHISRTNAPIVLKPKTYMNQIKFSKLDNYIFAGLYSQQQLRNFMKFLIYPQKINVAVEQISNRIIGDNELQDITVNMENLFTPEDLEKFKNTFMSQIQGKILLFGSYTGAILGGIMIIQIIKYLISTIINFQFLQTALGNGVHLFAAFLTSLTNYVARNNVENKEEDTQHEVKEVKQEAAVMPITTNTYPSLDVIEEKEV